MKQGIETFESLKGIFIHDHKDSFELMHVLVNSNH